MVHLAEFTSDENTTLWMGDLEPWMDEEYIQSMWSSLAKTVTVKVIKDKTTGFCVGYAFVDFGSGTIAKMVMKHFNGLNMPNSVKSLKLNWASGGTDKREEYSIFIGDLGLYTTEGQVLRIFKTHYSSCTSVKIMTDPKTGTTRGYGFVRFSSMLDQKRALKEMQSYIINFRPIRVSVAMPRQSLDHEYYNTTVFIGGLSTPVTEDQLRQYFTPFGDIVYVRIPQGKGCGFVQYILRSSAELAITHMNGYQIGNSRIRLSWGKGLKKVEEKPLLLLDNSLMQRKIANDWNQIFAQ
ncbi:unnamed protein product [Rhizopus stolonifer]